MLYLADVEKEIEKTWSGTTFSLYKSLSEITKIDPIFLEYNKTKLYKSLFFFPSLLLYFNYEKNLGFNLFYQKYRNLKLSKKKLSNDKILQIGDISNIENSAIYTDLSVGYLIYSKENDPVAFSYSGYSNISNDSLIKRNLLQKERYDSASRIFTMSKWLRDYLIQIEGYSKDKVIHVGGGINLDPNTSTNKNNKNKILFVGRDFKRKGGENVLKAFEIVKSIKPDSELLIVGPSQDIEKELINTNLEGVKFLGDLNKEDLKKYFEICDIFCMPSYFEAYGLVFIEALVYGLPCIANNKFEMKEFIKDGETGFLLNDPDDIRNLSEKMISLLENKTIHDNVKNNREYYLREYSWDNVAKRILSSF